METIVEQSGIPHTHHFKNVGLLAEASGYWTTTLAVCGCATETVRIVVAVS